MKFSVIVPTYNRSFQLLLTLTAFEKQSCPMDQFEIIVINDGSSDDTLEKLRQYQAPYRLEIISLNETTGRSAARNVGVAAAKEDYIIFCDPDFLVTSEFINVHAKYHSKYRNIIASGIPNIWRNVYTHLHSDFSEQEKARAAEVLRPSGLWDDQYLGANETIAFVTQDDVRNQTVPIDKIILPWDMDDTTRQQFSATDVAPWLLSITRCLSMSKKAFIKAGGFNEKFQKYGLEDWEIGYRLHRSGYKFISVKEVIGYHQQHPQSYRNADWEGENLKLTFSSHGFRDPELSLFAICPPWEHVRVYKNTLRVLRAWRNSKSSAYRSAAREVRRACSRSAKLFYENRELPTYQQSVSILKEAFIAMDKVYTHKKSLRNHQQMRRMTRRACRKLKQIR